MQYNMENLLFTGGTGFLGKNTRPILDTMYNVSLVVSPLMIRLRQI